MARTTSRNPQPPGRKPAARRAAGLVRQAQHD